MAIHRDKKGMQFQIFVESNGNPIKIIEHSYCDESASVTLSNGTKEWRVNGKLHRDNDLPAVVCFNGSKHWYKNGLLHRENDLPAVIYINGTQVWYKEGKCHRDNDLPAIVLDNGTKFWYKNGIEYYPGNSSNQTNSFEPDVQPTKNALIPENNLTDITDVVLTFDC